MTKSFIPICLLVLSACGNRSGNEETGNKLFSVEGNQITVAENSPVLKNIEIRAAETGDYRTSFSASGVVRAIPSHYAEIASPFAGRITKTFVRLGQKVSAGSPVFEISSPDFLEAGKAYFQAKQEMELALKNLNRERDLLANKVGAAKEVEEAEVNFELQKKEYEQALAALRIYQVNPDEMTLGQPLTVRSPIAGEIVKDNIVIGQYIREDADAQAVVADLNKVRITANVKEKDIPLIRQIEDIHISLPALSGVKISGKLFYTGDMLDEETRSVEVIVECENSDRLLKPFMYGTVHFKGASAKAVIVPNSAVLQDEENRYIVVSLGNNKFRKTAVETVSAGDSLTVVMSGIHPDDRIVTEGAFYFIDAR